MKTKNNKIWTILVPILFICLTILLSYGHGMLCNKIYMDGAKTFFHDYRINDIKNTIPDVIKEELLWRLTPLFLMSCILSIGKKPLRNKKAALAVCFCIVLAICVWFGYIHYNSVDETIDKLKVHIIMQGVLGLIYFITYNVSQTYVLRHFVQKERISIKWLSVSHFVGILASIAVHLSTNILLILSQTF